MTEVQFELEEEEAGLRLDAVLVRRLPGMSRGRVKELFESGRVRLNGQRIKKSAVGTHRDRVDVDTIGELRETSDFHASPDPSIALEVRYETRGYVVVHKPVGLPSHPLRPGELGTLAGALVSRYPEMRGVGYRNREPGILHRLDNDTSGLMLAARDQATFEAFRQALRAGGVEKRYLARCVGTVGAPQRIDLPIANDPQDRRRVRVCVDPRETRRLGAKPAITEVLASESVAEGSRVEVRADRARRHQVRAHLAAIGHPLLGDVLYGGPTRGPGRGHLLHASLIAFVDPSDGTPRVIESPWDDRN